MSIKQVFVKSANSGAIGTESPDYIVEKSRDRDTYIPPINFSTASEFVRFGSAKEYYGESIKRIYTQYPYDGSQKEKTQFHLSSSYLDRWMFDTKYPKYSGYAQFDGSSYIQVNRGYQEATTPASTKLSKLFGSKKVINDTTKRRKQTAYFEFDDGATFEWRMKIDGYNNSFSGSHLLCFTSSLEGYGINLFLLHKDNHTAPTGQNVFYISLFNNSGGTHTMISNNATITTSSIADGKWHHYAVSLYRSTDFLMCDFYFDGKINQTKPISLKTLADYTGSITTFIMSGSTKNTGSPFSHGGGSGFEISYSP